MGPQASVSSPTQHGLCGPSAPPLAQHQLHWLLSGSWSSPPPAVEEAMDDGGDQEERIVSYEEALAKIKDTTGVSDIQEVVDRFLNQVGVALARRVLTWSAGHVTCWPHPLSLPG